MQYRAMGETIGIVWGYTMMGLPICPAMKDMHGASCCGADAVQLANSDPRRHLLRPNCFERTDHAYISLSFGSSDVLAGGVLGVAHSGSATEGGRRFRWLKWRLEPRR